MLVHDALRHSAKLRPGHDAVVDERRTLTYGELEQRVRRLSVVLEHGIGLQRQERFALLSHNRTEFVEIVFAAGASGRVCVPLSYRLAPPEMAEVLADAGVRVVIAETRFAETLDSVSEAGFDGRVVWLDEDYERLLEDAAAVPLDLSAADGEIVVQMYTSGTTGTPKGVMLSHRNLMASCWNLVAEGAAVPSDRYLNIAPLCHMGAASRIFLLVHAGATHVVHTGFDPERAVAAMASGEVNSALVVPAMVGRLNEAAAREGTDLRGQVRLITYGTAPMPLGPLTEAMERFGCGFQQGYGLTEAAPNLTILRPEDHRPGPDGEYGTQLGSVGRETIGIDVRVVDAEDREVAPGEVGEVVARGPNIMEGYWNRPEDTAAALRGGWLRTGDLARIDEQQYIFLVDRSKDMLVSGGFNVYPREIERQLEQHPAVVETAVIGVPDARWGEVPVAYVVGEAPAGDLREFLIGRLADYKVPRRYEVVDALPRDPVGKVLKRQLREEALRESEEAAR